MNDADNRQSHDGDPAASQYDTPWIGVHVLTEFVFCPRAGMIAFDDRQDDPGEDVNGVRRLDYLPDYEVEAIEAELQRTWIKIWAAVIWMSLVAVGIVVAGILINKHLLWILILVPARLIRRLTTLLPQVAELSRRLQRAKEASPGEPDQDSSEPQGVEWWSLRKAGFTSIRCQGQHEDPELRLAGKPWRVLHKGSLRIPVFLKRHGEDRLYRQHFVRMAAYCHLLVAAEGGAAPYGIVMFGDSYEGLTVPSTETNREQFQKALAEARRFIEAAETEGEMPDPPRASRLCHDCPKGFPRVYRKAVSDTVLGGSRIPPFPKRGKGWKRYHSTCGDCFEWTPPHDLAVEKGIL